VAGAAGDLAAGGAPSSARPAEISPRTAAKGGRPDPWSVDSAWYTHPGGHAVNEDVLCTDEAGGRVWALVCDGLGGMTEGAKAAAVSADAISAASSAPAGRDAGGALLEGHDALVLAQREHPPLRRARATAAVAVLEGGALTWANVGDSRVYRFSRGRLAEVSPDDSAGYAAFRRGEVDHEGIRLYDGRSRLTAALGDDRRPEPHTGSAALAPGDAVLVCSDGFWQYVWDLEMEIDLAKSQGAADWLELMLLRLVQRSRLDGDNLTAAAFIVRDG
jgi:serine/threonine protein phosphatase PrpC